VTSAWRLGELVVGRTDTSISNPCTRTAGPELPAPKLYEDDFVVKKKKVGLF